VKAIYGLPDDAFGGYGLDLFSNFWVRLGGSPVLYGLGVALIGWMLGKTYRLFVIGMTRFGFKTGITLIYILLFILVAEARIFMFPWLLVAGWAFARPSTSRLVLEMLGKPALPEPAAAGGPSVPPSSSLGFGIRSAARVDGEGRR
jgi:hypothetical protein